MLCEGTRLADLPVGTTSAVVNVDNNDTAYVVYLTDSRGYQRTVSATSSAEGALTFEIPALMKDTRYVLQIRLSSDPYGEWASYYATDSAIAPITYGWFITRSIFEPGTQTNVEFVDLPLVTWEI